MERVLSIKASYLAEHMNYEVHILTLNDKSKNTFYNFSDKIIRHTLHIGLSGIRYYIGYIKGIIRTVKSINPDVISVCDDGLKGFYIRHFINKKIPVVLEKHASLNLHKGKNWNSWHGKLRYLLLKSLMNLGARSYNAFVVLTKNNMTEWPGLKNVRIIPNPLPFYPEECSKLEKKVVITVGNHGYEKGFDRLLKSWEIVVRSYPDWHLHIFGKIDSGKKNIKIAEKLQISSYVSFHNPEKNIMSKYKASSIYALPSRSEGFGMVIIEAMSFGVPCIAFDCPGGPRDIIDNGKNGILVNNNNIEEFAEAITTLIRYENKRKILGEKAREDVRRYLPAEICKIWDQLFINLIYNS
nr:glycosyltransferase family 4 protein [Lentiprolixibacter aurantiacus]